MIKFICKFIAVIAIIKLVEIKADKNVDYFFDKLVKVDGSNDALIQHLTIEKSGDSLFNVNGDVEQNIELSDDYKIGIAIYRAEKDGDEYVVVLSLPRQGCCKFLTTFYKVILYNALKDHSNAPHYNTCPIPPEKYILKDYPFNASEAFKSFAKPGFYRLNAYLYKEDVLMVGHQLFGHVVEK